MINQISKFFYEQEVQEEINNGVYEKIILKTYMEFGAKGVKELKKFLKKAKQDMECYDKSILKIINGILGVE